MDEEETKQGDILGIPFNFERPSIGRLVSALWQPGEKMLVEKPFGIGYTLNLANWRSWIVLGVVGVLLYQERSGDDIDEDQSEESDSQPVEVVVD
jgi:hypothetical protein